MLWRNTKECVVSGNSCLKNFVNFQEKHPDEIAFLSKVAGYLTLTGNVLLENLSNFQNRFHKKHLWMPASAISCHWEMFQPKRYFLKDISFDLIYNGMCSQGLTVWQKFEDLSQYLSWFVLGLFASLLFVLYSSGQGVIAQALSLLHIQLFFLNKKF